MSTKKFTLNEGASFTVRNPTTGRAERQPPGAVVELNINQARAFRDLFTPVGDGFEGVIHSGAGKRVADSTPVKQPTAEPVEVEVEEPEEVEADEVEANDESAAYMIQSIGKAKTSAAVEHLADSEQARSNPRVSVLAAADAKIEELDG